LLPLVLLLRLGCALSLLLLLLLLLCLISAIVRRCGIVPCAAILAL